MSAMLEGKRAVVTGASRGLGRAFAVALARAGADVVINGTDAARLAETEGLVRATGRRCAKVQGSIADEDVAQRCAAAALEQLGGLDVLVNNAGVNRDRTLLKMSGEEFDQVIAVNLRGSWAAAKHAAAAMQERGGVILNVTSNSGLTGSVGQTNYAAAKAGIVGMTFTWAQELARYKIRCNALWPLALTDMTRPVYARRCKEAEEAGRPAPAPADAGFGAPEDVAQIVVFLASDAAAQLNGQILGFNGRKLALWSHPREIAIERRPAWSAEELARDFSATAGRQLEELYRASAT
jgi:3-oxoacyl-[acyl-carrier protein] reductase